MSKEKIIISLLLIGIVTVLLNNEYKFLFTSNKCFNQKIGIIDGQINKRGRGIKYYKKTYSSKKPTHGDTMLNFALEYCKNNINLYYYDATDSEGNITTNNIIDGIEILSKDGVSRIVISLSSKKYNENFDNYLSDLKNMEIYASYNNLKNSRDYPAMYNNVIGVTDDKGLDYKSDDIIYKSNQLIINFNYQEKYIGNSYLALYTALTKK